jgi:hypothetical protein
MVGDFPVTDVMEDGTMEFTLRILSFHSEIQNQPKRKNYIKRHLMILRLILDRSFLKTRTPFVFRYPREWQGFTCESPGQFFGYKIALWVRAQNPEAADQLFDLFFGFLQETP